MTWYFVVRSSREASSPAEACSTVTMYLGRAVEGMSATSNGKIEDQGVVGGGCGGAGGAERER